MKKLLLGMLCASIVLFGVSEGALALSNSGTLVNVFTIESSANEGTLELMIEDYFANATPALDVDFYAKVDAPNEESSSEDPGYLHLSYEGWDDNGEWGYWDTDAPVDFYGLKAAGVFALYAVAPSAMEGVWNTEDLLNAGGQVPDLSNMTVWLIDVHGPIIPEPATVFLFGIGLLGIFGLGRRIKK